MTVLVGFRGEREEKKEEGGNPAMTPEMFLSKNL